MSCLPILLFLKRLFSAPSLNVLDEFCIVPPFLSCVYKYFHDCLPVLVLDHDILIVLPEFQFFLEVEADDALQVLILAARVLFGKRLIHLHTIQEFYFDMDTYDPSIQKLIAQKY